ncbi:unnamed protein product [Ectocarpus sp. CCAP 1310/34]|nr:unnamed protein product [Ectocarpus sp. CCAP 1310/34]
MTSPEHTPHLVLERGCSLLFPVAPGSMLPPASPFLVARSSAPGVPVPPEPFPGVFLRVPDVMAFFFLATHRLDPVHFPAGVACFRLEVVPRKFVDVHPM